MPRLETAVRSLTGKVNRGGTKRAHAATAPNTRVRSAGENPTTAATTTAAERNTKYVMALWERPTIGSSAARSRTAQATPNSAPPTADAPAPLETPVYVAATDPPANAFSGEHPTVRKHSDAHKRADTCARARTAAEPIGDNFGAQEAPESPAARPARRASSRGSTAAYRLRPPRDIRAKLLEHRLRQTRPVSRSRPRCNWALH